ncbi:hypothetical protein C8R45DRAFT_954722 [Mycena sanguinolenta]|nr:hypothetical protein C8R45DRAFT_954722 [Mycena sanguinolenta]
MILLVVICLASLPWSSRDQLEKEREDLQQLFLLERNLHRSFPGNRHLQNKTSAAVLEVNRSLSFCYYLRSSGLLHVPSGEAGCDSGRKLYLL